MDIEIIRAAITRNPSASELQPPQAGISGLNRPTRRPAELSGTGRIGAVMLLLFRHDETKQLRFVLTKRHENLRHHPGQISLPGGGREGDESLQTTAIRESKEEIGVEPDSIEILGQLTQVYIPPSDFTIHPMVGWLNGKPNFVIQQSEVAALIEVEVGEICRPDSVKFGTILGRQSPIESQFFELGGQQVWGATAKVLMDFRSRLV